MTHRFVFEIFRMSQKNSSNILNTEQQEANFAHLIFFALARLCLFCGQSYSHSSPV